MKFLLGLPIFRGGKCEVLVSGMVFHRCSWFSGICTRCPNSLQMSQICLFDFKNPNTKKNGFHHLKSPHLRECLRCNNKAHQTPSISSDASDSCKLCVGQKYFLLKKDRKTLEELEMILSFEITFWRKANEFWKSLLQWGWRPRTMPLWAFKESKLCVLKLVAPKKWLQQKWKHKKFGVYIQSSGTPNFPKRG